MDPAQEFGNSFLPYFYKPPIPDGSGITDCKTTGALGWFILCIKPNVLGICLSSFSSSHCRFWGTYSILRKLKYLKGRAEGMQSFMINSSGIQRKSLTWKDLNKSECVIGIRCAWDFYICKKLGKKKHSLVVLVCSSSSCDRQLSCRHVLLQGNPSPCSCTPTSPMRYFTWSLSLRQFKKELQRAIVALVAKSASFLLHVFSTRFWETEIFCASKPEFLFKTPLIAGSAKCYDQTVMIKVTLLNLGTPRIKKSCLLKS